MFIWSSYWKKRCDSWWTSTIRHYCCRSTCRRSSKRETSFRLAPRRRGSKQEPAILSVVFSNVNWISPLPTTPFPRESLPKSKREGILFFFNSFFFPFLLCLFIYFCKGACPQFLTSERETLKVNIVVRLSDVFSPLDIRKSVAKFPFPFLLSRLYA